MANSKKGSRLTDFLAGMIFGTAVTLGGVYVGNTLFDHQEQGQQAQVVQPQAEKLPACINREGDGVPTDVRFIVDNSLSNMDNLERIRVQLLSEYCNFNGNDNYRFSLVRVPGVATEFLEQTVVIPYSPFPDFFHAYELLAESYGGLGDERSYDIVHFLSTVDVYSLHPRENARQRDVLITDEIGQSAEEPRLTEADICNVVTPGSLLVVTHEEHFGDWDDCAETTSFEGNVVRRISDNLYRQ